MVGGQGRYTSSVANRTDAVDLNAMADDLVFGGVADVGYHGFDVGETDVFRGAARHADQMMMMGLIAETVANRAIAEDDTTDEAAIEQQLDRAVDGGTANWYKLRGELFCGEVIFPGGDVFDDLKAGRGNLKALVAQLTDEALGRGLKCHAAIITPR